jgi:hypothetical protein
MKNKITFSKKFVGIIIPRTWAEYKPSSALARIIGRGTII